MSYSDGKSGDPEGTEETCGGHRHTEQDIPKFATKKDRLVSSARVPASALLPNTQPGKNGLLNTVTQLLVLPRGYPLHPLQRARPLRKQTRQAKDSVRLQIKHLNKGKDSFPHDVHPIELVM